MVKKIGAAGTDTVLEVASLLLLLLLLLGVVVVLSLVLRKVTSLT